MEKIKIAFRSMPIKRDQSDEANDITEKAKDIRWLEEDEFEVPKCKECGKELRLPTCNECKHLFWNRTIKQTFKRTHICGILFNVIITCEILEEDIDKPVKCPFFEEAQFEESRHARAQNAEDTSAKSIESNGKGRTFPKTHDKQHQKTTT